MRRTVGPSFTPVSASNIADRGIPGKLTSFKSFY